MGCLCLEVSFSLFVVLVGTVAQFLSVSEQANLRKGEFWARKQDTAEGKYIAFFRMADVNCDEILTSTEVAEGVTSALGNDPFERYKYSRYPWDEWYCEGGTSFEVDPYYILIMISGFLVAHGRLDWRPCAMSLAMGRLKSAGLDIATPKNVTLQETLWWSRRFADLLPGHEALSFSSMLDIDGDGCLHRAEWDFRMSWFSNHWNGQVEVTSFSEMWDLASDDHEMASIFQQLNATCIDKTRFTVWSRNKYYKSIPLVNNTAACIHRSEQHQGLGLSVVHWISILGGFILVIGCICLYIYCHHRRLKSNLDESLQVQKLLKAKIDAWSTFDTELRIKVSDLQASFVHCLALRDFDEGEGMLSLSEVVHPEDADSLSMALEQLKSQKDARAMPILTLVRFRLGFASSSHGPPRAYHANYRKVEVLMTWNGNSSILVGLTNLDAAADAEPCSSQQSTFELPSDFLHMPKATSKPRAHHDDNGSNCASQHSRGEVILNGSDADSTAPSEAITFRSMDVQSHRGGQVTAKFSQFKTALVKSSLDSALSKLANDSSLSPGAPSKTSTRANCIGASL